MGTERSFGDWQEYSGFNYKAGTLDADWGEWEDRAGVVSHGATGRQADGATDGSLHRATSSGRPRPYLRMAGRFPTSRFPIPEDWSEMQVHVRRSPGGGRGMWEQVWKPRLEVRVFSYGVLVLFHFRHRPARHTRSRARRYTGAPTPGIGAWRGVATRCSGRRVSGKIGAKWLEIVLRGRGG